MFTLEPGFAMSPHRGPFAGAIRLQVGGLRVAGVGVWLGLWLMLITCSVFGATVGWKVVVAEGEIQEQQ